MFRLSIMLQCVAVPRESFSTELGSSTGDVAACETEPEIGREVTGCAVRESAGGGVGGERVGELLEEEDVFTGTEVKGEGLDVGLTGHGLCGQHGADNFRQLSPSILNVNLKGRGEYVSLIWGNGSLALETVYGGVEIVFFRLGFFSHDFKFGQFFGRFRVLCTDFGHTTDVEENGMRSSLVMHRRMIMQGIGHVLAGSIETRKTNIHAIRAVLQTSALYFASRNWGNYLIVETLSAFISVDNLVGTGRGEMRDVRTGGGGGGHCGRCVVDGGGGGDRDGRLCGWRRRGRERPFERRQDTMMADCMQTNSTTFERRNDKKTTFQPQNRRENLRIVDRLCAVESGGRFLCASQSLGGPPINRRP